jgi:hypothetical protein
MRPASGYGSGRQITARTTLNIATFRPMPSAKVTTTRKRGARASVAGTRAPYRTSRAAAASDAPARPSRTVSFDLLDAFEVEQGGAPRLGRRQASPLVEFRSFPTKHPKLVVEIAIGIAASSPRPSLATMTRQDRHDYDDESSTGSWP